MLACRLNALVRLLPRCARLAALIALLALPGRAAATPGVGVDQYRPPASSDDGLATQTPQVGRHLTLDARMLLDYARKPLVFETARGDAGSTQVALVRDQLRLWLSGSISLFDRLQLFAGLPLDLLFQGSALGQQPTATGAGVGDLLLGARGFIWGNEIFRLGAQLSLGLPTAKDADATPKVAGDSGVTALPTLLSELSMGSLRLSLEAGMRVRQSVSLPAVKLRDQLLFAAALRLPLASERLWLSAEVFGSTLSADLGKRQTTMVEALLGARLRVADDFRIGLAGSKGLTRGYGVPELRVLLSLAWLPSLAARAQPEPERTPEVAADSEQTPVAAAPVVQPTAAAPEPTGPADLDHDGWNDETDACPALAAAGSQDGCPELISYDQATGLLGLRPPPSFRSGTAQLQPRSVNALANLASALAAQRRLHVLVTSHLDPRQRRQPAGLGADRARALGQWLVEHGAQSEQLELYDCGSARPANRGPRSNARDERSELFLIAPLPGQGMPSTLGCTPVSLQPTAATLSLLTPEPDAHLDAPASTVAVVVPQRARAPEPARPVAARVILDRCEPSSVRSSVGCVRRE